VFVKICGFTRGGDIAAIREIPVNAAGLIFYRKSPRFCSMEQAEAVIEAMKSLSVKKAGVFVDAQEDEVRMTADRLGLDFLQLYDIDLAERLTGFRRIIRVYRVATGADIAAIPAPEGDDLLLLDTMKKGLYGGTGHAFDWNMLRDFPYIKRTIVAGGVCAENLRELLDTVRPFGVDICSGSEKSPGEKSPEKIHAIIQILKEAGCYEYSS
jgi:phosphoribosylanthranilate isomerase